MASVFPPLGGAAFIPRRKRRGLRRDLVTERSIQLRSNIWKLSQIRVGAFSVLDP
jgi:hypothetical protein